MAITAYDVGDVVRLGNPTAATGAAAFTNAAGAATDPTEVTLRVQRQGAAASTYRWPTPGAGETLLTREGTGRFYADVTLTAAGVWAVELAGTGAVVAMDQWVVFARTSLVPA